jgi:SH3-like domain-containing protein
LCSTLLRTSHELGVEAVLGVVQVRLLKQYCPVNIKAEYIAAVAKSSNQRHKDIRDSINVLTALRMTHVKGLVSSVMMAALFSAAAAHAAESKAPAKAGAAKESAAKPVPAKTAPVKTPFPKPTTLPAATPKLAPETVESGGDEIPSGALGDSKYTDAKVTAAGLPIPRFVSLRTNPINLRTGPGVRYPVDWVYVKRALPVEVIGEFDTWRRIRDHDGAEGWVHQSMLSGKRTAVVTGTTAALNQSGEDTAEVVAILEPGVVVNVQRCPADIVMCRVEIDSLQGWMKREHLWGIYPAENVQ